jgi:hypothetical protein
MSSRLQGAGAVLGRTVLAAVRFSLYIVLLVVGRVLVPIASLAAVGGLVLFLFSLIFWHEHIALVLSGAGLAAGGVVMQVFYDAALRLVATAGVVIVSEF